LGIDRYDRPGLLHFGGNRDQCRDRYGHGSNGRDSFRLLDLYQHDEQAVDKKDISEDRINDAVRRIMRAKFALGLFEHPYPDPSFIQTVRSDAHVAIARQAVQESLVLLKNDNAALPIAKNTPKIFIAGQGADDIGMMCGGLDNFLAGPNRQH